MPAVKVSSRIQGVLEFDEVLITGLSRHDTGTEILTAHQLISVSKSCAMEPVSDSDTDQVDRIDLQDVVIRRSVYGDTRRFTELIDL